MSLAVTISPRTWSKFGTVIAPAGGPALAVRAVRAPRAPFVLLPGPRRGGRAVRDRGLPRRSCARWNRPAQSFRPLLVRPRGDGQVTHANGNSSRILHLPAR